MIRLLTIIFLCGFYQSSVCQNADNLILSGPMVGHVSHTFAKIWVQTKREAAVKIQYWQNNHTDSFLITKSELTSAENAFAITLTLDSLIGETDYGYSVIVNGQNTKNSSGYFHTPPFSSSKHLPDLKIAFGSCVNIQQGGDYPIFTSIIEKQPDIMFWLGDNIYLEEQDWSSLKGIQQRYTMMRKLDVIQPLLSKTSNYAIWDDHDYGPNDSDRSFINKKVTLKAFKDFWANPSYGLPGLEGITSYFSWGDIDFFMLDNRYYRSPQKRITGTRTILGEQQLEWLIDALSFSEAKIKIILFGGLVLSTQDNPKTQNYIANYPGERQYIFEQIEKNSIKNVIFLTGDKHFSDISKFTANSESIIYEFTSSPLTATVNTRNDINELRVDGSMIQQHNFGLLTIHSESLNGREIEIQYFDSNGKEIFRYSFYV